MKISRETERKIDELLSRMTLEEKLLQMQQVSCEPGYEEDFARFVKLGGGSFLHVLSDQADEIRAAAAKTNHKIPPIFGIDAIHGHSLLNGAVIFPSQLATACSFDRELIGEMGRVTAEEVNADGLDWVFSPVLCLGRDTRWGRVDETFGEDAYLAGELGAAIVDGYERDGLVVACLKHYIGYGEATGARDSYDTEVTERKIREVFLRPFRRAIEAGAGTVMTAYGSIDGLPLTTHRRLLTEILKEELGFEGFVVTDWNNIRSLCTKQFAYEKFEDATREAVVAGNDMSMNSFGFYDAALALAREGKLDRKTIDDAVRRILRVKFSLGMFDPDKKRMPRSIIGCDEHIEINRRLTRESMVLLENNGVLPIKGSPRRIAVIGPNADDIRAQYGDWTFFSHPKPKDVEVASDFYTPLRGIRTVFADSEIVYCKGCGRVLSEDDDRLIEEAVAAARDADLIILTVGDDLSQNGEHKDRADLVLSGRQNELARRLRETGVPLVSLLVIGKPLCIGELAANSDALICAFNGGDLGGLAAAELIAGKFAPSGKLPISFPRHPAQLPCYYNELPGWHGGKYMDVERGPLYPFGYGLSYTTFEYSDLALSRETVSASDDAIEVSVTVKNTGAVDATEIAELYINDVVSTILTPVRELRGFERVPLAAGESRRVSFTLPLSDLAIVYPDGKVAVEPGKFEIMVGGNPASLLKAELKVEN